MHIALCDSNIADRKQMERLLTRESDRRISTSGVFYIDSFGSREALLTSPMVYDAYFLDIPADSHNAHELSLVLRQKGISSPIVFCISTLNYQSLNPPIENSFFLNKPILTAELTSMMDHLLFLKQERHVPRIELRNMTETFYLTEPEIIYCESNEQNIILHLADGTTQTAISLLDNLWMDLSPFPSFFYANKKTIVNARYVANISGLSVSLTNNESIRIPLSAKKDIKRLCRQFRNMPDDSFSGLK